jgi:hypothetical protein
MLYSFGGSCAPRETHLNLDARAARVPEEKSKGEVVTTGETEEFETTLARPQDALVPSRPFELLRR